MTVKVMLDDIVYQVQLRVMLTIRKALLIMAQVKLLLNSLNVSVVENIRGANSTVIELTVTH